MDLKLNSIMIGSDDPGRLVDFYTKVFGEPQWSDGGYTGWQVGAASVMIGPHDQVKGRNATPGRLIWNLETEDVRGGFDRIAGTGAEIVQEPYAPGGDGEGPDMLLCTFADPDGNYFQLASPMP